MAGKSECISMQVRDLRRTVSESDCVQTFQEYEDHHPTEGHKSYNFRHDESLWLKFKVPVIGNIQFNPLVTFCAVTLIWVFVAVCIVLGEDVPFTSWKFFIIDHFTWLYIGSQNVYAVFIVMLYFSKYGNLKLGKPDDVPEYNDVTWFVMLFSCGIGVGLFFYGVAEPIFHYVGPNRYTADPTMPDNTLAQIAINLTYYHWGIHSWIVYCLVGLMLSMMTYRENLPMTMKSCFYPLIGNRIFGWIGDGIDTLSILTTLFGVCTSLGLGARQLNSGFNILNSKIDSNAIQIQVITIWCITAIATVSTVSGVGMGIRRLSELCFGFGMALMIIVLLMDNTFYILNLFVQSLGFYAHNFFKLGLHTDAFEQVGPSAHAALGRFVPEGFANPDGPKQWIDSWTMFYWGWWISWSPFVGIFIAKISKGRTIRQFINGALTAPVLYSFMWMVIFGGAGIRQERAASIEGYCCPDTSGWFLSAYDVKNLCKENEVMESLVVADDSMWLCKSDMCGTCAMAVLQRMESTNQTYRHLHQAYLDLGKDFGSTSLDRSVCKLSCHRTEQMWFDLMRSYGVIGKFLSVFSLAAIVLYFVTSSDSGSLVIDCLSANGDPDPPKIQRVFWSVTEGATATALLVAGGKEGLTALQTVGIICGLPYNIVISLLCVSIWRSVKVAEGDLDPFGPQFAIGLFDCWGAHPLKSIRHEFANIVRLNLKFWLNIVMAPLTYGKVSAWLNDSEKRIAHAIPSILSLMLFVVLHILEIFYDGCWSVAWFFYLCFVTHATSVRYQIREKLGITGNPVEDFFAILFFYPNVAVQMEETIGSLEHSSNSKTDINIISIRSNGIEK